MFFDTSYKGEMLTLYGLLRLHQIPQNYDKSQQLMIYQHAYHVGQHSRTVNSALRKSPFSMSSWIAVYGLWLSWACGNPKSLWIWVRQGGVVPLLAPPIEHCKVQLSTPSLMKCRKSYLQLNPIFSNLSITSKFSQATTKLWLSCCLVTFLFKGLQMLFYRTNNPVTWCLHP